MAAPAVCCADKEDSLGVAHFRPLSLLCSCPDYPSQVVPFSPGFWVASGRPGSEKPLYPGGPAGAGSVGNRLRPRVFQRRRPSRGPPAAVPAEGAKPPRFAWPRDLFRRRLWVFKVRSFAQILRFLPRSHPILDTVTRLRPRGLEPLVFPVTAFEARPSGTFKMAALRFVI